MYTAEYFQVGRKHDKHLPTKSVPIHRDERYSGQELWTTE